MKKSGAEDVGTKRRGKKRRGSGALAYLDHWRKSAEFRELGRQACLRMIARWRALPRCGAKRRTDGEPCQNHGLEPSGRCRFHGGKSPRGKDWHKIQKRDATGDTAAARDARKLRSKERAAKARAARLAQMTPEELAAHRKWHETHAPGTPERRASDRDRRQRDREAGKLLAKAKAPVANPEAEALQRQIDELQKRADRARAEAAKWTGDFLD